MEQMRGRRVVLVGASAGIGLETARRASAAVAEVGTFDYLSVFVPAASDPSACGRFGGFLDMDEEAVESIFRNRLNALARDKTPWRESSAQHSCCQGALNHD